MIGVNLRAGGRGAHSAYQWLGDNALVKLNRSVHNAAGRAIPSRPRRRGGPR